MKIAVIGSGISGLTTAHLLSREHDVHLLEKEDRLGGHTATVDVNVGGEDYKIDTGFIVFNEWTYPNFIKLLGQLQVESQPSSMSFSVSAHDGAFEYAGNSLGSLFAQKKNILSLSFWRMLKDIVRFNRNAVEHLAKERADNTVSLGDYLSQNGYSESFRDHYLLPMGAAIWSATSEQVLQFPLYFFIRFFNNHGLLNIFNKPTWHVIKGGSRSYIPALIEPYKHTIRTGVTIRSVSRSEEHVGVIFDDGSTESFDHVVFATHSDQALNLLEDPSPNERDILGAIRYQENSVVLHQDARLLPRMQKTWSSWNYRLIGETSALPCLTYNMNILQGLSPEQLFCVSLNADRYIDEEKILGRYTYAHPQFDVPSVHAQSQKHMISGVNRTSYCGAYWANGFHEDGVVSAISVASEFGITF